MPTAHKIHLEESEEGILDLEPFRLGFTAMGFEFAAKSFGVGFAALWTARTFALCKQLALKVLHTSRLLVGRSSDRSSCRAFQKKRFDFQDTNN